VSDYGHFHAGGAWLPATGTETFAVTSPVTEQRIGQVNACSLADVDRAVDAARGAFTHWSASTLDERRDALGALRDALAQRSDAFVDVLVRELGVPVSIAKTMQVPMPLANLDLIRAGLDDVVWEEQIRNSRVVRDPVGVIAAITPWNFPLHQIVAKVAGAIGAGCTTVLKPSEVAPGAARLFMEAVVAAGLPPGVVNMVWGGPEVGERLVAHEQVDLISFTGSGAVGKRVLASAAGSLKRVVLELGGKSASLVLDDANLDQVIPHVVRRAMVNSGQTCVAHSRLVVPARLHDEAAQRIVAALAEWQPGDPAADTTKLGPVATARQFDSVNRHIDAAAASGARCLSGGAGRASGIERGYFVAPTVFGNVAASMPIAREEVFGPVLALIPYADEEEGIAIANGTPYGLSGGVWSADEAHALAVARRLRTGQVILNAAAPNLAAPFGGFHQSGFGRENGRFSIEGFLELKSINGSHPAGASG
jgi:aldehyde dehydrogenase (NAD+)